MEPVFDLATMPREHLVEVITRQRRELRQQQAQLAEQQATMAVQQTRLAEQAAMLAEQQEQIAALQQRLNDLEGRGAVGRPQGMPGLKPKSAKPVGPKTPPA